MTPEDELDCWVYDALFPSAPGAGEGFTELVATELERRNWPAQDVFAVRLAMEEALANAVEHGNQRDPKKQVVAKAVVGNARALISVCDEGEGFDASATPDPRLEENLEKPTGRGLLLINSFMTRVWRNEKGNEIFMEKFATK